MASFLLRRVVAGVVTLAAIASLCFLITRLAPGSPFAGEKTLDPAVLELMNRKYGLDRPLGRQYLSVMGGYLRGDLGVSYRNPGWTVNELIFRAFGRSLQLGALSFGLALAMGVPLGVAAAAWRGRWPDHVASSMAVGGICLPNFVVGPLLALGVGLGLGWLPVAGWPLEWPPTPGELRFMILPAFTLSLVHVAYIARLTRAGMLDALSRDYIRTARAKGLGEGPVLFRHALKNALTPVLSYSGPMAAAILTGSVVVEQVFQIPGLGRHFVQSAFNSDYMLCTGAVLVYSTLVVGFNLLVDVGYVLLDPRVRLE